MKIRKAAVRSGDFESLRFRIYDSIETISVFHLFTLSNQSRLCLCAVSLSFAICFGCSLNLHMITSDVSAINTITIKFVDYREILYEVDTFCHIEVIHSFSTPFLLKYKYTPCYQGFFLRASRVKKCTQMPIDRVYKSHFMSMYCTWFVIIVDMFHISTNKER